MTLLRQYERWECLGDGYPEAWHRAMDGHPAIKDLIREQSGHRCQRCGHPYRKGENERGEWSPCDEHCTHSGPVRILRSEGSGTRESPLVVHDEAQWRILTVHHLDEDKANCRWWNLVALCQRCHLRMQRAVIMGRPYHYEHSDWFKAYAAGFYAWKYLNEDLTREAVAARLDELLALEHRFSQEVLF